MGNLLHAAFCCYFLSVLGLSSTASATSLVAKVEKDRIILAADTRRSLKRGGQSSVPMDDFCKIVTLGKVGLAVTGTIDYHKENPNDLPDWNALNDFRTSYHLHPENLVAIANDWGERAKQHYTAFYARNSRRVRELAGADTVLILGFFVGWDDKGRPALISERVNLYETSLPPIVATGVPVYENELPYATNKFTDALIEGDPELVRATAKRWAMRAGQFPKSQRDWRWVAFLIQSTNAYDKEVGKDVGVLEIRISGSHWLHCAACGTHPEPQKPVSGIDTTLGKIEAQ
jgi:hypothetical protein